MSTRNAISTANDLATVSKEKPAQPVQLGKDRPLAFRFFLELLDKIEEGSVKLTTPDGVTRNFNGTQAGPNTHWLVRRWETFEQFLSKGSLGAGESYVDSAWDVADDLLCDFFGVILRNNLEAKLPLNFWFAAKFFLTRLLNSPVFRKTALRCVQSHYDLSNQFYALMLDGSMTYSCGVQLSERDSLEQMQEQKYDLVSKKLGIHKGGKLIDIGCGWGGMLIHAAKRVSNLTCYGVTLSEAQYDLANKRIQKLGLSDRVKVELRDFRDMRGQFDYFVSIGMFEHVPKALYGSFMHRAFNLLKPGGTGLLHTIGTIDPPRMAPDAWINNYIFPGTRLPRLEELSQHMRQAGLTVGHVENLKPHYAITLRKWKENFDNAWPKIAASDPKFDQKFKRMWNYYLQLTEAGFRYGNMQLYQLLFCKGAQWNLPNILRW